MTEVPHGAEDQLAEAFLRAHPDVAARLVESLSVSDVGELCRQFSPAVMAPLLAQLNPVHAASTLEVLPPEVAAELVVALETPTAALLLRRLPTGTRDHILDRVPPRLAATLRDVLRFPSDSAAALCDPGVPTVASDQTVAAAIEAIREAGRAHYYVFVVDRSQRLVGVVNLRDLLLASAETLLSSIARTDVVRLKGRATTSTILSHPSWRNLHALPVVDADGRFLGLLRHETLKRLEAEHAGASVGEAATTLAMELGELLWSAGSTVVGELAAAMVPGTDGSSESLR